MTRRKVLAVLCIMLFAAALAWSDAKQLDFLLGGLQNSSGKPLSGYIVVTRNAGNSAAKAVWEDKDKTLPTVAGKSQFTLNSEGKATVYGDGVYTIVLYGPNDTGLTTPLYTYSGLGYVSETDLTNSIADSIANHAADTSTHGVSTYIVGSADIANHAALTTTHGVTGNIVGTTDSQSLSSKTLVSPAISNFTNATHTHLSADTGGTISYSKLVCTVSSSTAITSGTGEDDLLNCTIPADSIGNSGVLRIFTSFMATGTADLKTVKMYYGVQNALMISNLSVAGSIDGSATLVGTGSQSSQRYASSASRPPLTAEASTATFTINSGTAQTLKFTGQSSGGTDTITQYFLIVEKL